MKHATMTATSTTDRADSILDTCLGAIDSNVRKIIATAATEKRDLTTDEIGQLLRVARVASEIKRGDRTKPIPDDAEWERLLEEARKYPELVDALRGGGDGAERPEADEDGEDD